MRLIKCQIAMQRDVIKDRKANVTFRETLDEPGTPRQTSMSAIDWVDMGMPDTITVTIEPGNFEAEATL